MCVKNITNDTATEEDQWTFVFDATIPITCSVSVVSCYFCLQTFFKKLHNLIKNILILLSILSGIASLISASIILAWNKDSSFEKCAVLFIFGKSTAIIAVYTLTLISYRRHHLTLNTAKSKAINVPYIVILVISVYVVEYITNVSIALGTKTRLIENCIGKVPDEVNEYIPVFDLLKGLTSMTIGLFYDGKLLLFLKNQNQVQQATGQDQVVPWKSGSDTYDYNVPVAATGISLLTTCVGSLIVTFVVSNNNLPMMTAGYIFPSILLPCLLLLTSIRTALEHKPKPQVPQGLCFHDSNETEMEDIQAEENLEEGNEEDVLEQNYDLEVANDVDHQVIFVQPMEAKVNEDEDSEQD